MVGGCASAGCIESLVGEEVSDGESSGSIFIFCREEEETLMEGSPRGFMPSGDSTVDLSGVCESAFDDEGDDEMAAAKFSKAEMILAGAVSGGLA